MNAVIKSSRQVKLESIWLDIGLGVVALVLSPWLARLLSYVEGWGNYTVNLYWLWLIIGGQLIYRFWKLWKVFRSPP
jgi:hypothetical protein